MGSLTSLVQAAGLWSYALIFALTAAETSAFVGLILPSETVILFAAALSAHGTLNPVPLAIAVVSGGIVGDSTGYALGRLLGKRVTARHHGHRIRPGGRIDRAGGYLRERGGPAVFTGRFIGFVRSFVPFAAGAAKMPYRRFLAFSAGASFAWGLGNVALGYFLGASAQRLLHTIGLAGVAAVGGVLLAALLVLWWRSRRRTRAAPTAPVRLPAARPDQDPAAPPASDPVPPSDPTPAPAARGAAAHGSGAEPEPPQRSSPDS